MDVSIHTLFARTLERSAPDSLVASIAKSIGRAIIEGELYPGDDLNSVELSRQFHTSRTPVREALLLLEKDGLVVIPPRRRPYVSMMSLSEVREIYQVRAHLHMLVSKLVVANATDEALSLLRTYHERQVRAVEAGETDSYFWDNLSFRATEAEICGNKVLQQTLDTLGLRAIQLRHHSLTPPGRMEQSCEDHGRLLRAYEERDARLAMALTHSLLMSALTAIERSGWPGERAERQRTAATTDEDDDEQA